MNTKTAGIFLAYLVGTRGVLFLELLLVVPIAVIVAWSGTLFYSIAASIVGFAAVAIMSLNTSFEKYFSVMPIKVRAVLLAEYLYFLVFMAVGTVFAIICAILAGGGLIVSLNVILFVFGYVLTLFGFLAMLWPIIKTWVILLLPVPIAQMYLVLGASRVHEIFTAGVSITPVTDTDVFGATPIWLVFIAVSLAIFIGSYFVTVKIEGNN